MAALLASISVSLKYRHCLKQHISVGDNAGSNAIEGPAEICRLYRLLGLTDSAYEYI